MTESTFAVQFCGNCLGGLIPAGTLMTADRSAPIEPMNIVSVTLKALDGPFMALVNALGSGGYAGVCKLYLGSHVGEDGEIVHRLGQTNPPVVSPVPASVIDEMVRVTILGCDLEVGATPQDLAAIALLEPFVQVGAS